MKRYKLFFAVLPLFALLLFSGCTAILERSYSYEAEHVSADDGSASGLNVPELSDYRALEGTLQELIERHVFVQTVRLVDYSGDVERDVQRAVHSIMATPLGDFAVNNIAYQSSRILSYYEIRFDVSYRRTEQELEELQYAENMDALISLMTEKMSQFSTSILAEIDDYNPTFYDFEQIYQNIYYSNPRIAYGFRGMEVHLYPDSGTDRIVEISISYGQPVLTLAAKSTTAAEESQIILDAYIGSRVTANRLKYIHDTLCATAEYDEETERKALESERPVAKSDPYTVYGTIIKGRAVSEGFALAFKQLCDMDGITCLVVSGKRDGVPHMWNLVQYQGEWSHIDCAEDRRTETETGYVWFGRTDEEMAAHYSWDNRVYPEASSTLIREMLDLEDEEETPEENDALPAADKTESGAAAEPVDAEAEEVGQDSAAGEAEETDDAAPEETGPENGGSGDETPPDAEGEAAEDGGEEPTPDEPGSDEQAPDGQ